MEFSVRSMKQTIANNTDKRVSEDAAKELRNLVENYGLEIAEKADELAESDGRKTVRDSDVTEALRKFYRSDKEFQSETERGLLRYFY